MYAYSERDEHLMLQSMQRWTESNVRLSAWNYLFPASQRQVLERARTQPYLTMGLAYSPNDPMLQNSRTYLKSVRRGRFVGHPYPTTSAFVEVLDTLYTSIGEQPTYTLYSSINAPSAAFAVHDDPELRPRLRPAPAERIIEQMTPGHVFLARLPASELLETAPIRRDLNLKRVLGDVRYGAQRLGMMLDTAKGNAVLESLAARTGADPQEIEKALRLGVAQGTAQSPETIVRTIAHEFAHANIQVPLRVAPSTLMDLVEGKRPVVDVATRVALESEFRHEAQADIFATAVTLDPELTVRSRYNMAAAQLVRRAASRGKQELRGWKYGDPFRMVVMDPSVVESEQSPLARTLRNAVQRVVKDGQLKSLEGLELVRDDGTVNVKDVERAINSVSGIAGMATSIAVAEAERAPREVRQVLEHYGDRLWAIPYMIGKASPELIGKEIEVTPEGVFLEGEKLDLAKMGLPDLELESYDRQELHPAQIRRSMNALKLYRRARRALLAGKRLVLQAGMAASEVVQTWRREFGAL